MFNKKIILISIIITYLLSISAVTANTNDKNSNIKSITLKPTKLTTTYKSGKYFKVKAINTKTKKPVPNVKILLKVFTGKKYKKIIVKTDTAGITKYKTSKLSLGKHKVIISLKNPKIKSKVKISLITITKPKQIIKLKVNGQTLNVKLETNKATTKLIERLKKGDITIHTHDYGNFEKVGKLGFTLPTNDRYITTSHGDIVLYGGDEISIFYNPNSWEYTKLGKIQNNNDLKKILGTGDATLILSLK